MYVLRVVTADGARRYAYGNRTVALLRMKYWARRAEVLEVTMSALCEARNYAESGRWV